MCEKSEFINNWVEEERREKNNWKGYGRGELGVLEELDGEGGMR